MGIGAEVKLMLAIVLIVVSIGLVQENLRSVFPIIDGMPGLIVGLVGLGVGIYFGFLRKPSG